MELGDRIKILRINRKISQSQLANQVGITRTYLSLIENNNKKPSLSLLERIGRSLQIPLHILFQENLLALG